MSYFVSEKKPESIKTAFKIKSKDKEIKEESSNKKQKTDEKSKQTALDEIMAMQEREKEKANR